MRSPVEFQPVAVGMWLDITTTTEITLRPERTINQVLSFGH